MSTPEFPIPPHQQGELEMEFPVQVKEWPNGKISTRLLAAQPVYTISVSWDGLNKSEAFLLEQHYFACKGQYLTFVYRDILWGYPYLVRYKSSYRRQAVRPGVQLYKINHTLVQSR